MKCAECRFFDPVGDDGFCRRYPPKNDDKGTDSIDEQPFVKPDIWCGEFRPISKKRKRKTK